MSNSVSLIRSNQSIALRKIGAKGNMRVTIEDDTDTEVAVWFDSAIEWQDDNAQIADIEFTRFDVTYMPDFRWEDYPMNDAQESQIKRQIKDSLIQQIHDNKNRVAIMLEAV